jgi:hypothetical protein
LGWLSQYPRNQLLFVDQVRRESFLESVWSFKIIMPFFLCIYGIISWGVSMRICLIIGRGYIHGFRGPNARTHVASTDSVDRTPELLLCSRIQWTERQKYRCVHGFREPNAGSCHCVHGFRELYSTWIMWIVRVTDSDAMKSCGGTCHVAPFMEVLINTSMHHSRFHTDGVPIKKIFHWIISLDNASWNLCLKSTFKLEVWY